MADPLGAAGADLVEALVRGAMGSPYAAADPAGGQLIARLIEHLARRDASRIGRLLATGPGAAQFEVEVHRTGDIVPEEVLRDLGPVDALREAVRRAGDPGRSVELVVVPHDGEDEVILASRPGQPLSYLFADDVRAAAAKLPATPLAVPGAAFERDWPGTGADEAPAPSTASVSAIALPEAAVATAAPARPASHDELSTAIEAALAEMSIQVDLAGVAELVQEAVIEHLRTEAAVGMGASGADPAAVAERVVAQLRDSPSLAVGLGPNGLREVLLELTETVALRDRRLAMEQQRMQMQLEALHAQIQHAEHVLTDAFDGVSRGPGEPNDDLRREVAALSQTVDDQLRAINRRIDQPPAVLGGGVARGEGSADARRVASDLSRVADRLDSLVRHLDQSVDLRALGRVTRSIERAATSLGAGVPSLPLPPPVAPVSPRRPFSQPTTAGLDPEAEDDGEGDGEGHLRERPLRSRARLKRPVVVPPGA